MKLLCSIPHPKDATSLYRGIGPLKTLGRTHNIDVVVAQQVDWTELKGADILFLQRPAIDLYLHTMRLAKLNKKPTWVDYDDNLHAIPLCNRRYPTYGHPQIQHNIATIVAMADIVTVSTPHLAQTMQSLLKTFPPNEHFIPDPEKIIVIPNAYDPELMPNLAKSPPERAKRVIWRGSDSHCKDLMLHTEGLVSAVKNHPDWNFEFIGEPFWWTIEKLREVAKPQQVTITGSMDPIQFFRYLAGQKPALVIAPLEDIPFNRSKSNIAWIEATTAGALTLAPAWEEWTRPGSLNYGTPGDFGLALDTFLRNPVQYDGYWQKSRDCIIESCNLIHTNRTRHHILAKLQSMVEQ